MIRSCTSFFTPILAFCALYALTLSGLQPVYAQEEEPPTISLEGAQPDVLYESPSAVKLPGITPAPANEDGSDSPVIQLQTPRANTATDTPPAPPVERDRASNAEPAGKEWLLPLVATTARLPSKTQIGESLPEHNVLRLTGETAHTELTFDLPEDIEVASEIQLALRSGIDVLIGAATLQATVNGAEPIVVPLHSIREFETVNLPTPALVVGTNKVVLTVHQPHRIFCGPEASFDVWTEINLGNSGVAMPADALRPDVDGFAHAMRAQLARSGSVDLLIDDTIDLSVLHQASDALMANIAGQGRVQVSSFYDIDAPQFAAVALVASDRSALTYRRGASGAIILLVEYQGTELPNLNEALPGSLNEEARAHRVTLGQPTALSQLGTADIIGNTHYFRRDVNFTLPDDWLLLANQKARLILRYGFGRSLAEGSILLVKVNDQTVRLLPLDRNGGRLQPSLPIDFNANLLNAGRNILSFEMMVPGAPPTEACPTRVTDMLVVLANSTLEVPDSPAMTLPGMTVPFAGLMPRNVRVPEETAADLDRQAQAIRLASWLGHPTEPQDNVTLTLARLSDLNLVPLDDAGVTRGQVQALLFPERAVPERADQVPIVITPSFTLGMPDTEVSTEDQPSFFSRIIGWIVSGFTREGRLWHDASRIREAAFQGSQQSLQEWLGSRKGNALLWRPNPEEPDALWLLLAPEVAIDDVGNQLVGLIEDRSAIGEAAVLRPDGVWDVWTPIRPPVLREHLFSGNLRTVLGNYASWSPLLFTLCLLVLAALSALPALFYILTTRDQKERS